ncbi:MAG: hypothetical protein CMC56_05325 [Flavobacteriaceae bacterium]|jgi:hypothetical protein|nr:hypothetical protein [Flavobacteriaceae bacterium]|tara:strand:+ start:3391 stop:4053 length:663 start_codon:yes stop_codon:yes gene_type:complete
MKKIFFLVAFIAFFSCNESDDQTIDLTVYNPLLTVVENLNNGVAPADIVANVGSEALYGLDYGGGYIFHFDENDGGLIVATDYSQTGNFNWGDIFSLDTNADIGSGDLNTQLIIDGNLNDNSSGGFEFGSDDYAFKVVSDLDYNGYNDWFVPSRDSMSAIYDNVHSLGLGNFDETIIYWSSTKIGYDPYVMGFNFDSWGGEPFLGSCASQNGLMIARKVN